MILDDFVTELKIYLKIKDTDITNDPILEQSARAADAFVSGMYSYHLLDNTLEKEFYAPDAETKFYLDAGPSISAVTYIDDVLVTDNDAKVIQNVAYYGTAIGGALELVRIDYVVGLDNTKVSHIGDISQACALAAYFYKQADKGLDGVMQYATGIKESARLYEGIPRAILQYFETKRVFRL